MSVKDLTNAIGTIKVGILLDLMFPNDPPPPWKPKQDLLDALRLRFDEALEEGLIDRPVELVLRECEGLPRGDVQTVIDAYQELVDARCVVIYGPLISDNAAVLTDYINGVAKVPTITMCGTDDWLGEWTFNLSNGSLPDEPHVIANIIAQAKHRRVGLIVERSLIGQEYLKFFHKASEAEGLIVVGVEYVPQTVSDVTKQISALRESKPDALLHLGFGYGAMGVNSALDKLNWHPPKYTVSSWEDGFNHKHIMEAFYGFTGLEQFDEENSVATKWLDRFEKRYKRRPEYFMTIYGHDMANTIAHALADAHPLSPKGVKEALERVKMLPAACGMDGTRISFGKWTRRGWMGAGYMIAREFNPNDTSKTIFRGRYGAPQRA